MDKNHPQNFPRPGKQERWADAGTVGIGRVSDRRRRWPQSDPTQSKSTLRPDAPS
jgi:hypothetical protein